MSLKEKEPSAEGFDKLIPVMEAPVCSGLFGQR